MTPLIPRKPHHGPRPRAEARPSLAPAHRPTETATPVVTIAAALVCKLLGVTDTDAILEVAAVLGFVPYAITWIVTLVKR